MAEYAEEEFGRLRSESPNHDLTMNDTIQRRTRSFVRSQRTAENAATSYEDTAMDVDTQNQPGPITETDTARWPKFIIAVDFGTTFSSVAVLRLDNSGSAGVVGSESIKCVDHYPDMPPGGSATAFSINPTVPTELMCFIRKSKDIAEVSPGHDSSDQASTCSLVDEWASSGAEDSDGERPRPQTVSRNSALGDSIWGWGVHCILSRPDDIPEELKLLTKFKLQLDESTETRELRRECWSKMRALKGVKVVDIIAEYLAHLLRHAKARLTEIYDLRDDSCVEFVLCLPTEWTDKAARIMQTALTAAIEKSQIAKLSNGAIEDLFIVAESEAAAAYALVGDGCASKLTTHESFLILDCGGGTVDAVTYTLTQQEPVRLKEEVSPKGVSCGSSFLNERFKKLLQDRLKHATIIGSDSSLDGIITAQVQAFEHEKRSMNILDKKVGFRPVYIQGLQADSSKRFRKNALDLSWEEMSEVFKHCIRGVAKLMLEQLAAAKEKGVNVQTVILIGGFGASPSLENHLKKKLRKERNLLNQTIDLVPSRYVESAVARGAVLRALRKEDGPQRFSRSSYGVLRTELYNHQNLNHRRFRVHRDRVDGNLYVVNTITWILDKDTLVPPRYEIRVRSRHIFKPTETQFLCEEILYVSSERHPSGYKDRHHMNKGAEEAGRIVADMTFLLTENRIEPITAQDVEGKSHDYYEIEYDLWIIIIGRTLRFEARSPLNPDEVKESAYFCIAAGFVPGTE